MKTKLGEKPSALESGMGVSLEWQEFAGTNMTLPERVAVGMIILAIALAAGFLISGCGGSKSVETSSGMSHNQPDVADAATAVTPATVPALPAASLSPVRDAQAGVVGTSADSLPPEVVGTVQDKNVAPGQVIEIVAEGSLDVTEITLTDGLNRKQALKFDSESGLWRTYYRIPLENGSDRIGLSLTAKNGVEKWRRVWIFLNVAEPDSCGGDADTVGIHD